LLLSDLTRDPQVSAAASNLTTLSKALDTTSNNLDRMPEMAARAREIALADIENQRLAAQGFFTQERTELMDALARQRIAATADLRRERLAATADLGKERQIVLDSVHQEEMAAMNDLHTLSQQTLNDVDKRSRHLVDHLFWRAIELVLIALLLFSLTAWILLRRFVTRDLPNRGRHDRAA
jgi:hypothetical protein